MNTSLILFLIRIFCLIKNPKIIICFLIAIIIIIIPFISIDWVLNIIYYIINDRELFQDLIYGLLSILLVLFASGKETIEGSGYDMPYTGRGNGSDGESVGPSNPNSPSDANDGNQVKEGPSSLDKGKRKATEQEVLEQERKRPRIDPPFIPIDPEEFNKEENLNRRNFLPLEEESLNRRNFWEVALNYNQDKDKEPNKISSKNTVEDNDQHISESLDKLIQEDKRLYNENYKFVVESRKEKKLSKDINLPQEERNMHKDNSEELRNMGEITKNQHEILHRSIREQLERSPDPLPSEYDQESSEYDQDTSSESSSN